jgi:glycosyltransferase involved in cell wall biosynthesis
VRKIMHVITGLSQGGAEGVLLRLVSATVNDYEHSVVTLTGDGAVGEIGPKIRALGIRVTDLEMTPGRLTLRGLWRLRQAIARSRPDVIQTWMFHADLLGGLVAKVAGNPPVVWGIRHSDLDGTATKRSTRAVAWVLARLSGLIPKAVVWNSREAMRMHRDRGYHPRDGRVIPNGFDLSALKPDAEARARVRAELSVGPSEILLGNIAHWSPEKDHDNLFEALAILKERGSGVRCLIAGARVSPDNEALAKSIAHRGLENDVLVLGFRPDVPDLMNAMDLSVLSSLGGEGFPNAVAEAMACGTPCVVTDVGDSAMIVGDLGWVVPPREPALLADAIERAIREIKRNGEALSIESRTAIGERFGMDAMCRAFGQVWSDVA